MEHFGNGKNYGEQIRVVCGQGKSNLGWKAVKWLWKDNPKDPCGNRTSSSHYTGDQITKS